VQSAGPAVNTRCDTCGSYRACLSTIGRRRAFEVTFYGPAKKTFAYKAGVL
jgi:hypothetical protein